ncbi:MAG: carboxypeptidase-like regulatory domain-containing protein, partial [Pirellulales bacterium]
AMKSVFDVLSAAAIVFALNVAVVAQPQTTPAEAKGARRPSLDDLLQKTAQYERAYFPFHIKAMLTFRMGEGLTPEQRARYPWGDGRKHGRLMEYAQKGDRVWMNKETQITDDKPDDRGVTTYSDGEKKVQISRRRGDDSDVYIEHDPMRIARWTWAPPIMGIFPIAAFSDGDRLTRVFENQQRQVQLDWDGVDARLSFEYGPGTIRTRFVLWLSHVHDWHPIKLQRYMPVDAKQFRDEWEATRFVKDEVQWRVAEGTIRYHDSLGATAADAKIAYSLDFKVVDAEWGKDVSDDIFKYEIPPGAEIHDPKQPKTEEPVTAAREVTIRVVDIDQKPVAGASVVFRSARKPREFDRVTSDENGIARSKKLPDENVSLEVGAEGFRAAQWVIGRGTSEHRVILPPRTRGITLDEAGTLLPRVWITSDPFFSFRGDGLPQLAMRDGLDSSDDRGRFELKKSLTLRNLDTLVPLIAVDKSLQKMAARFVSPRELAEPQTIILRPVCEIHGACLLEGVTEQVALAASVVAENGQQIGSVAAQTSLTPA